jgi:hypothetical protein
MGRARAQEQARDGFAAVFGTRRGSVAAQAQRDDAEREHRNTLLDEWCERIAPSSKCPVLLAAAYKDGAHVEGADGYAQLIEELLVCVEAEYAHDLAVIASAGDIAQCAGLTQPAITALAAYFTQAAVSDELNFKDMANVDVVRVFDVCFPVSGSTHRNTYYRRLQPLCEAIGAFIAAQPSANPVLSESGILSARACTRVAQTFMRAPTPTLNGPLRSWILAFAARLGAGHVSAAEKEVLQQAVARRGRNRRFANAFAPIIEGLHAAP